ncbi:MAG: ribosomal-protein-alanine N-acetyltransferase [Rhodobacterales bacterium]|nr:MAG: ribosomal-protein-alanine N-acetyltransferase [Rhodobacterales bacterium]
MTPEALATLHARAFTMPRPWSAEEFTGWLADPLAFLLVEGDAGFLLGRAVAGEAELLTVAVAPESRGRGLGQRLVSRFLYQARLRGAEVAFLEVAEDNAPARAVYSRAGFTESGRRRGYYRTPEGRSVDALVLARVLSDGAVPPST